MRNTIIVSVLLFVAVVAASIFYFSGLGKEQKEESKPLTFLPKETLLIAAFKNDETTDNIFRDFEIFEAILGRNQYQDLQSLKQKLLRNEALTPYLEGTDIFVSFHQVDKEIEALYTVPSKASLPRQTAYDYLESLSPTYQITKTDTLDQVVYSLTKADTDSTLHIGYTSDIFFVSYSRPLLETVLDKNLPKLSKEQIEHHFSHTNRNVPLSIYFAHENIPAIAKQLLRNKPGDFVSQFLALKGQSTWNISYKQDALILTGESELADKDSSYLALFAHQRKTQQHLYRHFPSNTAIYLEYSASDTASFRSDLRKLLEKRDEYQQIAPQLQAAEGIASHLGGDFAIAELSNRNYLGFIAVKDSTLLMQEIGKYAENVSAGTYRFRNSQILYALYGDALKPFQHPYFTIRGNVMVVANASSTLNEYQRSARNQNFLTSTVGFKNVERIQGNEANVTFFLQTGNASSTLLRLLPQQYAKNFRNKDNFGFSDFYSWSAQLSGNGGKFVSSIYASYKSSTTLGATPEWTYQLNHRLITRPYVFEHSDTSQFIFLQEQDHTVHSIHPNGTKLWSTVFSGRIVGDVIQLRDRSIVLVTDRNRLYRFDTEGKSYTGFSTGMPHEPTGTPLVVDLQGTTTILIPTRRQIMAYTLEGAPVENWESTSIDGHMLHGIYQQDEYIVAGSTSGTVYYFATDGSIARSVQTADNVKLTGQLGQLHQEDRAVYLAVDTEGQLHQFALDSTANATSLPISDQDIRSIYFQQLAGTSHPEMVVIQNNKLSIFDLRGNIREVYHYNFTREIGRTPLFLRNAENQPLLGVSSGPVGLIYLLRENGHVVNGFPIEALPLFYYGKINYNTGNFLLCSRRDHKLYAYRH